MFRKVLIFICIKIHTSTVVNKKIQKDDQKCAMQKCILFLGPLLNFPPNILLTANKQANKQTTGTENRTSFAEIKENGTAFINWLLTDSVSVLHL